MLVGALCGRVDGRWKETKEKLKRMKCVCLSCIENKMDIPCVHLNKDAAKRPHINRTVVRNPENDLFKRI